MKHCEGPTRTPGRTCRSGRTMFGSSGSMSGWRCRAGASTSVMKRLPPPIHRLTARGGPAGAPRQDSASSRRRSRPGEDERRTNVAVKPKRAARGGGRRGQRAGQPRGTAATARCDADAHGDETRAPGRSGDGHGDGGPTPRTAMQRPDPSPRASPRIPCRWSSPKTGSAWRWSPRPSSSSWNQAMARSATPPPVPRRMAADGGAAAPEGDARINT